MIGKNRSRAVSARRNFSPSHLTPSSGQSPQQHPNDFFGFYGTFFFRGILAVGMVYCFTEYVAEITLLEGPSMYPTLLPFGEIVLIDKYTLRRIHGKRKPKRNRSLVPISEGKERREHALQLQAAYEAENSENVDEWYEARVSVTDRKASWPSLWQLLTTPLSIGDVVVLQHPNRKGTICKRVVGLPGDTVLRPGRKGGLLVIPDGHLWVEGDNPSNSSDSRTYGTIPMALLRGRVLCRIWPLRGNAIAVRGTPPRHTQGGAGGYTVLPAGYDGQRIVKRSQDKE